MRVALYRALTVHREKESKAPHITEVSSISGRFIYCTRWLGSLRAARS